MWRDMIRGCFGMQDKIFAGHPNDAERAKAMLTTAFAEGASWSDVEAEACKCLQGENCTTQHINEQIARMQDIKYYLDGAQPHYWTFAAQQKP